MARRSAGLDHSGPARIPSPMEDLSDRIARLEQEVAMMKKDATGS
jgi:hypothetical protein